MRSDLQKVFEKRRWGQGKADIPRSGAGSTMAFTQPLRQALPELLSELQVGVFLDAPCGDWTWMQHVDLGDVRYIGADISSEVVNDVRAEHAGPGREFLHLDITSDPLPKADLMMCRDCLFHLTLPLRWAFLENFAASDIPYLFMTMHHLPGNSTLSKNGSYARFNPCSDPFNFDLPIRLVSETGDVTLEDLSSDRTFSGDDRSLGLWTLDQVREVVHNKPAEEPGD